MPAQKIFTRVAEAGDSEALAAFAARTFPLGGRPNADPRHISDYVSRELTAARFAEHLADPNVVLVVADHGGEMAGFAMLLLRNPHPLVKSSAVAELRKFYVDPRYHGTGLANEVMKAALDKLPLRTESVWLSVFSENARAVAFYTRWGFAIHGRQIFQVGDDPQEDFVMVRARKEEG